MDQTQSIAEISTNLRDSSSTEPLLGQQFESAIDTARGFSPPSAVLDPDDKIGAAAGASVYT